MSNYCPELKLYRKAQCISQCRKFHMLHMKATEISSHESIDLSKNPGYYLLVTKRPVFSDKGLGCHLYNGFLRFHSTHVESSEISLLTRDSHCLILNNKILQKETLGSLDINVI